MAQVMGANAAEDYCYFYMYIVILGIDFIRKICSEIPKW